MTGRAGGALLLIVALLAVVVARSAFGPGAPGQASPAPLPEPPQVGDCLLIDPGATVVAPCAGPHDGEVTARWLADDPQREAQGTIETCGRAGTVYAGLDHVLTVEPWSLSVAVRTFLMRAPDTQRLGPRGWSICVLRPGTDEQVIGSLRGDPFATGRPAAFASCSVDGAYTGDAGCAQAHNWEYLGDSWGQFPGPPPDFTDPGRPIDPAASAFPQAIATRLVNSCEQLSAQLTGAIDPTYGGRLKAAVLPLMMYEIPGADPVSTGYYVQCAVGVSGDRLLNASVVGIGDSELPLS